MSVALARAPCATLQSGAPKRCAMTNAVMRRRSSCCGRSTQARTIGSISRCQPSCMPPAAEPYSAGVPIVFDTSAWNRRTNPAVFARWAPTRDAGLLVGNDRIEADGDLRGGHTFMLPRSLRGHEQLPVEPSALWLTLSTISRWSVMCSACDGDV